MKSLIRSLATLSLIGTTVLGSWLIQGVKVLALPTEVIVEKLRAVPVFTVADSNGSPLIASGENNAKVAGVFISQEDAKNFVKRLKQENPDLGKQVQVVPVSLGEIFQLTEANLNKPDAINFAYVPMQEEVAEAKKILSNSNQEYKGGVPLFVAKAGEGQGYLTIKQNENEIIPFFFEQDQVQKLVERFKKDQPEKASNIAIEVVALEGVLSALKEGEDEMLKKIVIWPSQESLDFLRSTSQNQQKK
jgi:hypothetical protein